jgi:dTDP-4-amino-4,6-dideoxygalactose transaminase
MTILASPLALQGGPKVRTRPFPAYRTIGAEEKAAVSRVMDSGCLSKYLGAHHEDFMGGPEVRAIEAEWAEAMGAKHALAVNSASSGLHAAIGAAGVGPGDEVIVTPWSITVSATAPMVYGAVPVFADIDPETWTLDPARIRARVTPRTRAIIVVHIFGQAADMDPIMRIAAEHGLTVIEDCAQAPFGRSRGRAVGTLGHMGVFSLNYHKHIHTGEGGVVTTNDARLAERVALIRNHAEAVVAARGVTDLNNMLGFNFRMGEIEAAIGRCQLAKGSGLIGARLDIVQRLEARLRGLPELRIPTPRAGDHHVYYVHPFRFDERRAGISRDLYVDAVKAELPLTEGREGEGVLVRAGYVKPIYLQPMFRDQIAFGGTHFPFQGPHYAGKQDYRPGLCPNAETANADIVIHELIRPPMNADDIADVANAFLKVHDNLDRLRDLARRREAA